MPLSVSLIAPLSEFSALLSDPHWTLDRAALLLGKLEGAALDIDHYLRRLDSLAESVERRLPSKRDNAFVLSTLVSFLAREEGFCGEEADYFNPQNAYFHMTLDRRRGIPITLSLLYLELARRIRLPLVGIGMPGHFLVRLEGQEGVYLDPFYRGESLDEQACEARFRRIYGADAHFDRRFLRPVNKQQILARMINNLRGIFGRKNDFERVIRLIDLYLVLYPEANRERFERGLLYRQLECFEPALRDFEAYLASLPQDESRLEQRQKITNEIVMLKRMARCLH